MYQVGTGAGQAWQFREGEGESAILKTPLYDNYLSQVAILNEQERRMQKAKEGDDYQKRIDTLNQKMAESPFAVDASTKQAMMQFLDRTAELKQQTGKNPFSATNTDPRAQQMQKDYWKYFSLPVKAAEAMKHFEQQNAMLAQSPEKYKDDEVAKTIREGLGGEKLVEYVMSGRPLPTLRAVSPSADIADELAKTMNVVKIDPTDIQAYQTTAGTLIESMFSGPKASGIIASARQLYDESNDATKAEVDAIASSMNMSIEKAMVYKMGDDIVTNRLTPQSALMAAFDRHKDVGTFTSAEGAMSPLVTKGINEVITDLKGQGGYVWDMVKKQYGGEQGIRDALKTFDWGSIGQKWKQPADGGGMAANMGIRTYNDWMNGALTGNQILRGAINNQDTNFRLRDEGGEKSYQGVITNFEPIFPEGWMTTPGVENNDPSTLKFKVDIEVKDPTSATGARKPRTIEVPYDQFVRMTSPLVTKWLGGKVPQAETTGGQPGSGLFDSGPE